MNEMNLAKIKTAARKALMAADAYYYSWSPGQQERFRSTVDETAQNKVDTVLLNELLDIQCAPGKTEEAWENVEQPRLDYLNWAKLLTTGIGEDTFFLNEAMAQNTSLLDFETLYDYDLDDHLFQEKANKADFKDYESRPYCPLRFSLWARLIIADRFYYAALYSLAGYLTDQMNDKGHHMIETLIPQEFIDGKEHGKPEQGGLRWDVQINAHGLEKQLEELRNRWYRYMQQRRLELNQSLKQSEPAVFMEDIKQGEELHRNFILNNESALKQVRWRHFLTDCERIQADYAAVAGIEKDELEKAECWLRQTHEDIMQNFDPDVVRLRKKRKIIVAPGAFDDLIQEGDEESD